MTSARDRFVVEPGSAVDLAGRDPRARSGIDSREAAKEDLARVHERLDRLQVRLMAEDRRSLLVVLQGMDTSGKDGTIRKGFASLSPSATQVTSFGAPTEEELAHDFLWRIHRRTPAAGLVGIFNRSHYEDVVVVRVRGLAPEAVWRERYDHINAFERELVAGGATILKLFLHISKDEQRERLLARLDDPDKRWKFNPGDLEDRERWDDFQAAYEDALTRCSTPEAPWFVVPADRKWYRNWAAATLLADTLEGMAPEMPRSDFDVEEMRAKLEG